MKANFNILDFLQLVRSHKKKYFIVLGTTFVISAVIAYSLPKVYTSSITLAPEFSSGGLSVGSNVGALASMAGINLNHIGGDEDAFYPELYPEIVSSTDFLEGLLNVQVTTDDGELSTNLEDYLVNHQSSVWWAPAMQWVRHLFKETPTNITSTVEHDPKRITEDHLMLLQGLSQSIVVKLDTKTSIIDIQVTMQDPYIAACLVDTVSSQLQSYIYRYRTNKAQQDLNYLIKLEKDAREEYMDASKDYADYVDSHQNILLERFKTRAEYLENEMSTRYQVYNQMSQQVAMARAKLQARTPVYNVVQSSYAPLQKSAPKRVFIIFLYEFIVFCGYSLYLVLKTK